MDELVELTLALRAFMDAYVDDGYVGTDIRILWENMNHNILVEKILPLMNIDEESFYTDIGNFLDELEEDGREGVKINYISLEHSSPNLDEDAYSLNINAIDNQGDGNYLEFRINRRIAYGILDIWLKYQRIDIEDLNGISIGQLNRFYRHHPDFRI